MIDENSTVQRKTTILTAEVDDDIVMVNVESGFYYGIADVARDIWDAIEQPRKVSDLIGELASVYDVDRSTCEAETLAFLNSMREENLLEVSDEPTS